MVQLLTVLKQSENFNMSLPDPVAGTVATNMLHLISPTPISPLTIPRRKVTFSLLTGIWEKKKNLCRMIKWIPSSNDCHMYIYAAGAESCTLKTQNIFMS